jgi:hypothetical protein
MRRRLGSTKSRCCGPTMWRLIVANDQRRGIQGRTDLPLGVAAESQPALASEVGRPMWPLTQVT